MNKFIILSLIILLAACTPKTPEMELSQTIEEMMLLIDDGNGKELLAKYADLSDVDRTIIDLPESTLNHIKVVLLKIKNIKPVLTNNESLATYSISGQSSTIKFTKLDNRWLLKNN